MSDVRIYVASLAAYNSGTLHGAWIDANQSPKELHEAIKEMLKDCPEHGEEWAIHDHEGFEGYRLSEYASMEDVSRIAEQIEEHGPAFTAFLDAFGITDIEQAVESFQDAFQGEYPSVQDYAEQLVEDLGYLQNVPDHVARYFDFQAFGRDIELGGDITTADAPGGVYIFNSNW